MGKGMTSDVKHKYHEQCYAIFDISIKYNLL